MKCLPRKNRSKLKCKTQNNSFPTCGSQHLSLSELSILCSGLSISWPRLKNDDGAGEMLHQTLESNKVENLVLQEIIDTITLQTCLNLSNTQKMTQRCIPNISMLHTCTAFAPILDSLLKHDTKPWRNCTILHPGPFGAHRKTSRCGTGDFFWSTKAVKQGAPARLYAKAVADLAHATWWPKATEPSHSSQAVHHFLGPPPLHNL